MNPLLTAAALVLAAVGATAQTADPFQPVVHVEYGRAVLVQRGSRGELLLPETEHSVSGIAYLMVGAGGRTSVTWRGRSSLLVQGPAEIEWAPGTEPVRGGTTKLVETGDPSWSVLRLGEIDIEVRRGSPELKLPGGWHARLDEGAFFVSGNGRDACDFEVRAGGEFQLRPEARSGFVRPPVAVATGMRVRLSDRQIATSRPDTTADLGSWGRVTWPWRTPRVRGENPPSHSSVPVEPEPPTVTVVETGPVTLLETHPIMPILDEPGDDPRDDPTDAGHGILDTPPPADSPLDFRALAEDAEVPGELELPRRLERRRPEPIARTTVRSDPGPTPVPTPEPTPEPPVAPPTVSTVSATPPTGTAGSSATFVATQWGGTTLADLEGVGAAAFQRSPYLRATRIGPARWRISLSTRADGAAWFYGKDEDVELQPGASVTVGADGFVQSKQGLTRSVGVPAGRPPFSAFD